MTLKSLKPLILFVPFVIACIIIRALQIVNIIDPVTGYYSSSGILKYLLTIVAFIGIVIISGIILIDKPLKESVNNTEHESYLKSFPILIGFLIMCVSANYFYKILIDFVRETISSFTVFLIINTLVMMFLGFHIISKRQISKKFSILFMVPTVFYVIKAGMLFRSYYVINSISENVISLVNCFLQILFFLMITKLYCGFEKNNTKVITLIISIVTALVCISTTLSAVIINLFGSENVKNIAANNVEELSVGLLALCVIIGFLNAQKMRINEKNYKTLLK